MSSLKRIICLANSWKFKERCIAGIEIETGQWIRPVCDQLYPEDGRVPQKIRLINGREPELLDILEIPLADTGNNFGFESENRSILSGKWRLVGKAKPDDLLKYSNQFPDLLHNALKYVTVPYLQALPLNERRTLQLVTHVNLAVKQTETSEGKTKWKGSIVTNDNQILENLNITDPSFVQKLNDGELLSGSYLVTLSLGMPWKPPNWEDDDPCWKLIAGVIELPHDLATVKSSQDADLLAETDKEMKRLGWSVEKGRDYLIQTFRKSSRYFLSPWEFETFLSYLKSEETSPIADIEAEMLRVGWDVQQGQSYLKQRYDKTSRSQLTNEELQQFLKYLKSLPTDLDDLPF